MGVAWAALAGSAINAIGSGISASSQRKSQERARAQELAAIDGASALRSSLLEQALAGDFNGFSAEDIFGTNPQPTDVQESTLRAVEGSLANFGRINDLTQVVNDQISQDAFNRAAAFDPNFQSNISELSDQARSLIRGEIPQDVFDFTVRDRAGRTNQISIPGTAGPATARDLGLTSLDLQQRGASIFQTINSIRDQVDPLSRRLSQTQFLTDPATQINVDTANAQLAALPDPTASNVFALQLQGGISDAYARAGVTVPVNNTLGNAAGALGAGLQSYAQIQGSRNRTNQPYA